MQRINHDITQSTFKHMYLLYGVERYLSLQYTERLKQALCAEGDMMNVHFFKGKDISVSEVISLANTMPFLAERRVIFLKDTNLFSGGGDLLADYLNNCNESTYFVFTEDAPNTRNNLFKTISKLGTVVNFGLQDENTLKRWVGNKLRQEGKKITENSVLFFLSKTGFDMSTIQTELEKLVCFCMDQEVITNEDIEIICTDTIVDRIFTMTDAIASQDKKAALTLYYDLLALRKSPFQILAAISRHCNTLFIVSKMKRNGFGNADIAGTAKIPVYYVNKYIAQSGKFKEATLTRAVTKCVETEEAIKTGRMKDTLALELLILSVFD